MRSVCPVCDALVILPKDTEESEIITCAECHSRLVVTNLKAKKAMLEEAPKIEEDWGE